MKKLNLKKKIANSLLPLKKDNKKWALLVGPEGGFSLAESEKIYSNKKVIPISLGNRLLRSDTAITVALFCIQELLS